MTGSTSASRPWSPSRRAAVALLALAGGVAALAPVGAQDGTKVLMRDLASRWNELEAARGDAAALRDAARELGAVAERLGAVHPALAERDQELYRRLGASIVELVVELDDLAARGEARGADQTLEALRATCVECHVRFRDDNAKRGLFPAVGNTVSGAVTLADVDGAELADRSWVLLFLEPTDRPAPAYVHRRWSPRVSQSDRSFTPRVLPVVRGTVVDFPNDDSIFHNVFSLSKTKPFDLGTYEPGDTRSVEMTRSGLVKLYCNIHPEMQASVVVLEAPWFALTDARGEFVITGVPDGEYVLRAWNDRGVEESLPIRIEGGDWRTVELALRETRRVLPHRNKFGKPYPEKY